MTRKPSPNLLGKEALRRSAALLFTEQNAIAVLANVPERMDSREQQSEIDDLATKTSSELKLLVKALHANVRSMRSHFGIQLEQSALLAVLDHIRKTTKPNQACYVPVWKLSEWIAHYDTLGFAKHFRISIDPHCIGRDYAGGFEVRALEVTMFEDMASLFNLARTAYLATSANPTIPKPELKSAVSLYRATASAAFYFVESFMNELAVDYVWEHRSTISPKDLVRLTEWDEESKRRKFVSTRDKLVLYPRIIAGSPSPLLDEDTCPELRFIVGSARNIRDSIVHASTARKDEEGEFDKEDAIFSLKYEGVEQIVDAAVTVIMKINSALSRASLAWLIGRGSDGFFPSKTFD